MSQYKPNFIKVPPTAGYAQTMPVEPDKRIPESEIRIQPCTADDAMEIAEGLYKCFLPPFWDKMEPISLRPPLPTRIQRFAKRITPTFSVPTIHWIKAVFTPTNQIIGIACWVAPGNPIHNHLRRSAIDFYDFQSKMNWTDAEIDEMWEHVSDEAWNGQCERYDETRREVLGDEEHWFLAPLITWPEFQGRGVGKKLLNWAIEQADKTDPPTPMYLESASTARAVYMHCGFVPQGKVDMLRRGPAVVRGLEVEEGGDGVNEKHGEGMSVSVEAVAREVEGDLAA